ncbi:hypothetical protein NBH00_13575 [Paraconexibacter antarcticus]|uniref:Ferric oxidoreductase domain-containing protein n=1 Tax=Paraconexibacter antarcticus TaxID=2949664 RepID=A0ABY5DKV9_9ACTN|nr:hypothetical protein [Paraconexibacter antarcticus]UTI62391.1 hypothetical protein NBH00_13575 [Paraconexibacter antarcticus]
MVAAHTHLFWLTSRAAGIGSLVLASLSVGFGLLMGGRMVTGGGKAGELRVVHEALSLATLIGIVVHGGSLLFDAWLHPSVLDVTVPFVGVYRPFWNGIGIVGGWMLVALGLGYYVRARIGTARWKRLHRLTAVGWLLGLGHALGAGTDAGQPWFLAMLALTAAPALVLLVLRTTGTPLPRRPRRAVTSPPVAVARPAARAAVPAPRSRPLTLPARTARTPTTTPAGALGVAGLLREGHGGALVLCGALDDPDPAVAAARAVTRAGDGLVPDVASLPCFLSRVARRAPAGAPLHVYVSRDMAARAQARVAGRDRWVVHVAPDQAEWLAVTAALPICPAEVVPA